MYPFSFVLLFYLQAKPNPTPRYNVNRADFDNMHAALYTIDWLDIMEPMNTQEPWEFFKTVLQDINDNNRNIQKKRHINFICLLKHLE